jgi:heme-degrading monooxygenase HmoA
MSQSLSGNPSRMLSSVSGVIAAGSLLVAAAASYAQANTPLDAKPPGSFPVVTVVKVPAPWYAPRVLITSKMRDTIPQYQQINGLAFKAYSFAKESGDFGGIYFWQNAAAAQAWFNPEWFARVQKERGVIGKVRFFEAPVTIDNTPGGTQENTHSQGVATLVEIDTPRVVSKERLIQEFKLAMPTYQKIPGLLRKHFTISDAGTFGGIYLWKDEASAQTWFNQTWHAQVQAKYGQAAKIEWFATPILSPSSNASSAIAAGYMTVFTQ